VVEGWRRAEALQRFFASQRSPLEPYAQDFIRIANTYDLPYYLLPVVSCVESSCGKNYQKNAFGWGSDKIDYGNDFEDIQMIAQKISSLPVYKEYMKTKDLFDFALAYNHPYAKAYYKKLIYFRSQLP